MRGSIGIVAIYGRVSTDDQSSARQQRDLRAFAPALVIIEFGFAAELGAALDGGESAFVNAPEDAGPLPSPPAGRGCLDQMAYLSGDQSDREP
jgi:hypothetical protein